MTVKQTKTLQSQNTLSSKEQQQTQSYFPSGNSPRKELQGWGGGIVFCIHMGKASAMELFISLLVYIAVLSQGSFTEEQMQTEIKALVSQLPAVTASHSSAYLA